MFQNKMFSPKNFMSVIFIGLILTGCFAVTKEDKHPKSGSVQFGAKNPPVINTSPELASFKTIFADVAEKVIPVVVSITSTQIDTIYQRQNQNPYDFFGFGFPFGEQQQQQRGQQQQKPQPKERRQSGVGSGVIVSSDGYILTNSHVVKDANEIKITLHDDREYPAKIIGFDTLSDVAVVKITENVKDLPIAYLGNSDKLRPGDWVMAVGNPFNLSSTVTTGIVSALGRHTGGEMYQNFIQTDAAINPGNSGGALVNIDGELVGINTMIYTRSGGYMGIGFAIPISMAKNIMEQLIYTGEVKRGWLGISIGNLDQNMMDALGLNEKGVLINEVFENEPAKKAGIQSGDVVISIDGKKTPNPNELRNVVASLIAGKKYTIEIIRDGKKRQMVVVPAVRGANGEIATIDEKGDVVKEKQTFGMTLKEGGEGKLEVAKVEANKTASNAGIRVGDVVLAVKTASDKPFVEVSKVEGFNKEISQAKGQSVVLRLERNGQKFFVSLKLEK